MLNLRLHFWGGGNIFNLIEQGFGKKVAGISMIITIFIIACVQLYKGKFRNEKAYLNLVRKYPRLLRENETSEGSEKRMKPIYEVLYLLFTYFIWLPVIVYVILR
jgi:hypothetical protein